MQDNRTPAAPAVAFRRRSAAPTVGEPLAMTVKEAAGRIGVSYMTLWRAIREGEFPGIKLRGRILVPVKAVELMFQSAVETGGLVDAPEWTAAWTAQTPAVEVS